MKLIRWSKQRVGHKLKHFNWLNIKKTFREHGLALVVIIVGWEIIEDILFPIIFALLGNYVHPIFFVGIPASLIICLHWFMVPLLWGFWIRFKRREEVNELESECGACDEDR